MTRLCTGENRCHRSPRKSADSGGHGTGARRTVPGNPLKNDVQTNTCGTTGAAALSCPRNWASIFEDFHLPSPSCGVRGQAARSSRWARVRGLVRRALVRILRRQKGPLLGGWQSVAMHVDIGLSGLRHRHCRVVRRVPATGKISCFPIPGSAPVLLRARRISRYAAAANAPIAFTSLRASLRLRSSGVASGAPA